MAKTPEKMKPFLVRRFKSDVRIEKEVTRHLRKENGKASASSSYRIAMENFHRFLGL